MTVNRDPKQLPNHELMLTWVSLIHASTFLKDSLEREFQQHLDITMGEQDLLKQLAVNKDRLTLTELAKRIFLSKAGMTKMLNRLERQGLVKREPVPGNRKSMSAVLTRKGRSTLTKSRQILLEFVSQNVGDHLSERELKSLGKSLQALLTKHDRWDAQMAHLRGEETE